MCLSYFSFSCDGAKEAGKQPKMYLLKIKRSSPLPVRAEGPKTQVLPVEPVDKPSGRFRAGAEGWTIQECSCALLEDKFRKGQTAVRIRQ